MRTIRMMIWLGALLGTLALAPTAHAATTTVMPVPNVVCTADGYCPISPAVMTCESSLRAAGTWVDGYACNTLVSTLTYYKGWGNVRNGACPTAITAWRWNNGWTKSSLASGTRVYIWPFATDWSWVWTSSTGWLAMRDADLVINQWRNPAMMLAIYCPQPALL